MKHEDGFHFEEYRCASGKPETLIIFLHGHANHPDMFKTLPPHIQREFPNADILMVQGPEPVGAHPEHKKNVGVPHVDDLYTWYKVDKDAGKNIQHALRHFFNNVPVVDQLNKFADEQLKKRGLKDENLVLYGFSLGGAMVVQMATKRDDKCAAVVAHSSPVFPVIAPKSKPDTMLIMGEEDQLFYKTVTTVEKPKLNPLKKAFDKVMAPISIHYNASLKRLRKAGLPVTGVVVNGMAHTINEESFKQSIDFLSKKLKK
jgi:predicted esterase